jgi:hypothetical protein
VSVTRHRRLHRLEMQHHAAQRRRIARWLARAGDPRLDPAFPKGNAAFLRVWTWLYEVWIDNPRDFIAGLYALDHRFHMQPQWDGSYKDLRDGSIINHA